MGYKKFLGPGSEELVTRNSWEKLSTFSPDFPVKDSWEFPWIPRKDSWEFQRIFLKIVTWVAWQMLCSGEIRYSGQHYMESRAVPIPSLYQCDGVDA